MKYSLFLVEDKKCPLKYLGATTLWNKFVKGKYKGSGIEWVKHLKECGCPHNRVFLLHATNDYEIHKKVALECSNKWNVKDNPFFLNTYIERGVPEILDDELHEFRQKIGYSDYDKLVKDQMEPDIKMYTSKGTVRKIGKDMYDRSTPVTLNSIKDYSYTEEEKLEKEILFNSVLEKLLPKAIKRPSATNELRYKIYKEMEKQDLDIDIYAYEIYAIQCLYHSRFVFDQTFREIAEIHPYTLFLRDDLKDPGRQLNTIINNYTKELKKYLITQEEWIAQKNST